MHLKNKLLTRSGHYVLVSFILFDIGLIFFLFSYSFFMHPEKNDNNKEAFYAKTTEAFKTDPPQEFNGTLLTHRLIEKDIHYGVTDKKTAMVAAGKINRYLENVTQKCKSGDTDDDRSQFISCAGNLIGQHFYYEPGEEISNGYVNNNSDCDASTYMLMDAARLQGIEPYIIYSPFHAFFAWKDSTGHFRYWETTTNNNEGQVPDFSNDEVYGTSMASSYYIPFRMARVEIVYEAIIYGVAAHKPDIEKLYEKHPDDAVINNWFYYTRAKNNQLTSLDAQRLIVLLQTDITSVSKRFALTRYYMAEGAIDAALDTFREINLSKCGEDCFRIGEELNLKRYKLLRPVFNWYSGLQKGSYVWPDVRSFFWGVYYGLAGCILILSAVFTVLISTWKQKIKASGRGQDRMP